MLTTIHDDTWKVLNMQHITQIHKDVIIQVSPVVATKINGPRPHGNDVKINSTQTDIMYSIFIHPNAYNPWEWVLHPQQRLLIMVRMPISLKLIHPYCKFNEN